MRLAASLTFALVAAGCAALPVERRVTIYGSPDQGSPYVTRFDVMAGSPVAILSNPISGCDTNHNAVILGTGLTYERKGRSIERASVAVGGLQCWIEDESVVWGPAPKSY